MDPVRPKKLLIVALGLILGGLAGVLIALVRHFIVEFRFQLQQVAPVSATRITGENNNAKVLQGQRN